MNHHWGLYMYRTAASIPARLARLMVEMGESVVSVSTCNVGCFSVGANQLEGRRLDIDGCTLAIPDVSTSTSDSRLYFERDYGRWRVCFHFSVVPITTSSLRIEPHDDKPTDPPRGRVTTGSAAL